MNSASFQIARKTVLTGVALGLAAWWCAALRAADDLTLTWRPYEVAVTILGDGSSETTPRLLRRVRDAVGVRARAAFGAAWQLSFVEPERGASAASTTLDEFGDDAPLAADAASDGKRLFILVRRTRSEFVVEAREWDASVRTFGPTVRLTTFDRDLVADLAADVAVAAFRCLGEIEDVRDTTAVLRLRGGSLLPESTARAVLRPSEGFIPITRSRDRDGNVLNVAAVPWTMLSIDSVGGAEVRCTVVSGLRNPFASRRRARSERLAIAAGRPLGSTTLTVVGQGDGRPMIGCTVYEVESDARATRLGVTDDRGQLEIAAADGRVRTLIVSSRYLPLARFPLIAGLQKQLTATVPGDERLLAAEHWLAVWQAEFTDLFIERRVMVALADVRLEREEFDKARALLERLERLGSAAERIEALENRRRAAAADGTLAAKLVDRLYGDSLALVRKLDDGSTIAELRRRLEKTAKKSDEP